MMNMLTEVVRNQNFELTKQEIIQGLSLLANVCLDMVQNNKFEDVSLNIYCLRAMTASIIIVDIIDDNGVFCRKSPINIKNAVLLLREKMDEFGTVGLINALKFTTKHMNDPETPTAIRNLLV